MTYHFRNLIFEGGGVKGIAYVGAIEELRKKEILKDIKRVGGTSAGAINAVLVGLNFSAEETKKVLWELDFNDFKDDSFGIVRDAKRLLEKFGWYKGDYFRNWIADIIKRKTGNADSTFADINAMKEAKGFKDLFLIGTNLSTRYSEVFSFKHTPRVCVADAVRISMSIPLFFQAIRNHRDDVYVDGGVLKNYPVKLFDRENYIDNRGVDTEYYTKQNETIAGSSRPISKYIYNRETLGFRLDTKEEITIFRDQAEPQHHKIKDFLDYIGALIETNMESQQNNHLHSDDWQRTIYVDSLGVKTTEFDISAETKTALIDAGKKGVKAYFEWFDKDENKPINK